MIEEKCFRVPERIGLDIADELDKAFAEGWRYIAHFPVDRGTLLVLAREKAAVAAAANGGAKVKGTRARS